MLLFENRPVEDGATLGAGATAKASPFLILWPGAGTEEVTDGDTPVVLMAALWDVETQHLHWMKRLRWRGGVPDPKAITLVAFEPLMAGHAYTFALFRINPGQKVARVNAGKRRTNWGPGLLSTLFPLGVHFVDNVSFHVQ